MSEGKRYYWLKLYDDFFDSLRIKRLRRMAGGDTFLIIYLKLQLKAMKTDGIIKWHGYDKSIVDELALDLDEEADNVSITLSYLKSCGLAESSNDEQFFLPFSVENVGSECSSAERVRKYRERAKLEENTKTVTLYEHCNGEKEKEKEKEKESEKSKSFSPEVGKTDSVPEGLEPSEFSIILNDKTYYHVPKADIAQYADLYPAVDIGQEMRKMIGWCESNPKNRKTRSGVKRFINGWLSRAQDSAPRKREQKTSRFEDL